MPLLLRRKKPITGLVRRIRNYVDNRQPEDTVTDDQEFEEDGENEHHVTHGHVRGGHVSPTTSHVSNGGHVGSSNASPVTVSERPRHGGHVSSRVVATSTAAGGHVGGHVSEQEQLPRYEVVQSR